ADLDALPERLPRQRVRNVDVGALLLRLHRRGKSDRGCGRQNPELANHVRSLPREDGCKYRLRPYNHIICFKTGAATLASPLGPQVQCVLAAADIVGESLVWSASDQALLWVDIGGRRIHRLAIATGRHELWSPPELPTSIGLRATSGAIVGLTTRVA